MLMVISPAKSLDFTAPDQVLPLTTPELKPQIAELAKVTRKLGAADLRRLMHISEKLATLNHERFQQFDPQVEEGLQAVIAFNGDVYAGLAARELDRPALEWAQDRLRILSGLYGVLRPLDRMQPYRLEMGTALATARGSNLYQFWGPRLAEYLDGELAGSKHPVVVNLASQEYFKAVDRKALQARVVECVFEEYKAGGYKVVSFFAKRARGLMARYAITHRIATPAKLRQFDLEGYAYDADASEPNRLVFRRRAG